MTRPDPLAGGTATGYVIKDAIDTDISRPGKHIAQKSFDSELYEIE
jgi:hypothetical protein